MTRVVNRGVGRVIYCVVILGVVLSVSGGGRGVVGFFVEYVPCPLSNDPAS